MNHSYGRKVGARGRRPKRQISLVIALAALVALATAAIAAAEEPTTVKAGNLVLTINGGVTPKALSKKTWQPIALNVQGKIATADGNHPPALKEIIVDTDKAGTIDARGVPVCKPSQLEATTTDIARKTCKAAIVGTGTTDIEVEFPEQAPIQIHTQLIAFNGPGGGVGTATILRPRLPEHPDHGGGRDHGQDDAKEHKGPYGTHSVASVPKIAGGSGSVKAFSLTFPRTYSPTRAKSTATCSPSATTAPSSPRPKRSSPTATSSAARSSAPARRRAD